MGRLICAEALLQEANRIHEAHYKKSRKKFIHDFYFAMVKRINKAPAVDAVEVVRCKDCKWFNKVGCAIHIVDDSDKPKENDFCSFGERRTE